MNLFILSQYKLIQQLYKDSSYIDSLINIDDFFELINLYAFPNWFDMEVVDLKFMRYFTSLTLKCDYKNMPHPKGATLLTKYNCQVKYKRTNEYITKEIEDIDDTYVDEKTGKRKPKLIKKTVWIVDILIPNRLIVNDDIYNLDEIQAEYENNKEETDAREPQIDDLEMNEQG